MALTNITDVKAILDNTTLSDTIITSYISAASTFVTGALGTSTVLTTAQLKEIERWVAAHMISVTRERTAKKEEAGGAKVEYTGEFGVGLQSTSYGQMAIALDVTGVLGQLSLGLKDIVIQAL